MARREHGHPGDPSGHAAAVAPGVQERLAARSGGGAALPAGLRATMESAFGADFSRVRIHTDSDASALSRQLNAEAFTVGSDVYFNHGRFAPRSSAGLHLIAHELTHVVQQAGGIRPKLEMGRAGDRFEREADRVADSVVRWAGPLPAVGATGVSIARAPGNAPDRPCITGFAEGEGWDVSADPDVHKIMPNAGYVIMATLAERERPDAFFRRAFTLWIGRQFGSGLSAAAREQMMHLYATGPSTTQANEPVAGCQYPLIMSQPLYRRLMLIGGRDADAHAADRREKRAGLPTLAEAAAVGVLHDDGSANADKKAPDKAAAPVPDYGDEFRGGKPGAANAAALPARMIGPDAVSSHGIGTFAMRLDYWPAGPDLWSQVIEASNFVRYHWERYDITALVKKGIQQEAQAAAKSAPISPAHETTAGDASVRRAQQAGEDLADDEARTRAALRHPIASAGAGATPGQVLERTVANYLNLELLPASEIVAAGGIALGALADALGGTDDEREIPFPSTEGYALVRCIAQPAPQGKDGEQRRAASVKTKIVEIVEPKRLAHEALDNPEAEIAELKLMIATETDPQKVAALQRQLTIVQRRADGDIGGALAASIDATTADASKATGARSRELGDQAEVLRDQLALVAQQSRDFAGPIYTPRGAFASKVTGETYPLFLRAGRDKDQGARIRYRLSDATSRDGQSWTSEGATEDEALGNVLAEFAHHNGFGRGQIALRFDASAPFKTKSYTLESYPTDVALVRQRLHDYVTLLVALSLFVPGVGEVAGVLAAALAAESLYERWSNHTLRLDESSIGDVVSIVTACAMGASVIGRLNVARAGGGYALAADAADAANIDAALARLQSAQKTATVADRLNAIAGAGGMMWAAAELAGSVFEVSEQETQGKISHAQARRKRAELLLSGLQQGALLFAMSRDGHDAEAATTSEPTARDPVRERSVEAWEKTLNSETRAELATNKELAEAYASMDEQTRDVLTNCASFCLIPTVTKRDVARVRSLLTRLAGEIGDRTSPAFVRLKIFFHVVKDLPKALSRLDRVNTADELDRALVLAFRDAAMEPVTGKPGIDPDVARATPGSATGGEQLPAIKPGEVWLGETGGQVGLIPGQVAQALRAHGRFANFDDFRAAFWDAVAADPVLRGQFSASGKTHLDAGNSPGARGTLGGRFRYELHHITPIENGGGVYDLNNIVVVSPAYHSLIHDAGAIPAKRPGAP